MCVENIALQSLQIFYVIVLRAEIATIFGPKMVAISVHIIKENRKNLQTSQGYFSVFYSISRPNFGSLLLSKGSFREFRFVA